MRKYNFIQRLTCLTISVLIFMSYLVFPSSAWVMPEGEEIPINYSLDLESLWFPTQSNTIKVFPSNGTLSVIDDSSLHNLHFKDSFIESRLENGIVSHCFSVAHMLLTPDFDIDSFLYDLSKFNLEIYWRVDNIPDDTIEGVPPSDALKLSHTLGTTEEKILDDGFYPVPCVGSFYGSNLNKYIPGTDKSSFHVLSTTTEYGDTYANSYENSYVFTDTDDIESFLSGEFYLSLPFYTFASNDIEITFEMSLWCVEYHDSDSSIGTGDSGSDDVYSGTDTTDGVSPDKQGSTWDFMTPVIYDYDTTFYLIPPEQGLFNDYSVTNFYANGTGIKIRDYTDKFVSSVYSSGSGGALSHVYDTVLGIGYKDGVDYSTYFTDGMFNTFTVDFECNAFPVRQDFEQLKMSDAGFRMEFYFSFSDAIDTDSYEQYLQRANSYYYGFEPFSLVLDNITIPYDYFTFDFSPDKKQLRATLELYGNNIAHRNFMNAISTDYYSGLTLTFSLPIWMSDDSGTNGVMVGFTTGGFWRMSGEPDSGDIVNPPSSGDSSTTPGSGITQEDLDAAYRHGYNQGISDGSDKNYVFGYFNGIFSGLNIFYKTIADGITIGGITLGTLISSLIVIVALSFIIKKVT